VVTLDEAQVILFRYAAWERVAYFVRGEEYASEAVDRSGIGQFYEIRPEGLPNFVGRQLLAFRGIEDSACSDSDREQFAVVGGAGEGGIVEEGLALEDETVAVQSRGLRGDDVEADAGERATFAELDRIQSIGDEVDFHGVAEPKGDRQIEQIGIRSFLGGCDNAVFAYPECFSIHLGVI